MLSKHEIAKFCYMYCNYAVSYKNHWTNVPHASIKKDTLVEYDHCVRLWQSCMGLGCCHV